MFRKYMHVKRLGSDDVTGILDGMCYIFSKLDGTNASVFIEDGEVCAGSRNRKLSDEQDNFDFYKHVKANEYLYRGAIETIAIEHDVDIEDVTLYGEWLVPHTIHGYRKEAWRKFYLFDVLVAGEYIPYEQYKALPLTVIPPIAIILNPTTAELKELLDKANFMVEDGFGEGVVIKRYDYVNPYGRTVWAKVVRHDFKSVAKGKHPHETVEYQIAAWFLTQALLDKEIAKLGKWESKKIPQFFGATFHALITEGMWDALKKFKPSVLNIKQLRNETIMICKQYLADKGLL